ncbi:MAG: hypothetical protein ACYSR1_09280 [Planctomycetota bacterium]|jgi:hypothetical protein
MAKKKKQPGLIYFVISVMVLYSFYYLFIEPQTKSTDKYIGKQSPELQAFAALITAQLGEKSSLVSVNETLIEIAEGEWLKDPFYDMVSYGELDMSATLIKTGEVDHKDSFNYSGFINVNGKKLAIINDIEYEVGETLVLESGLFVLGEISSTKVIIENKANKNRRVIQLQKIEE